MSGKVLYRFPLCLLAYEANPANRMLHVTAWCSADVGRSICETEIPDFGERMPTNFNRKNRTHVEILKGMKRLNLFRGDMPSMVAQADAVQCFLNNMQNIHGKHAYVAMREDFVWEQIKKSGLSWREFSVLAAVYSFIGKRKCAYITRSVIQHRALGYKTAAMMQAEMPSRKDGDTAMTIRQINYTLDRLHERKLFARVRKDPWHTFYSNRLDDGELETKLLGRATYKDDFHGDRKQRNSDFMQRVKAARANVDNANVNTADMVHDASTDGSLSVHGVSTLGVSTSQNYNPFTEPQTQNQDIKHRHSGECLGFDGKEAGKASEEMSAMIGNDGKLLTRREAEQRMNEAKRAAGLIP